ncbi:MAG: class I SAM-dependent methyltransferase [Steroidobacteraceae bacterium]
MAALYDTIGVDYRRFRRPDARMAAAIDRELGPARTVVNVGAGAGSYEPPQRQVIAVEPSIVMLRQRARGAAPAVQASAMALPFRDAAFEASMAILTVHHWPDWRAGIRELRRVAGGRIVIVTWDPSHAGFWLTDYIPELLAADRRIFPPLAHIAHELGSTAIAELPIPHDCSDGVLGAYWRRPEAYLNDGVRAAISTFSKVGDVSAALQRLRQDLDTGAWQRRYGAASDLSELDLGYRILVSN